MTLGSSTKALEKTKWLLKHFVRPGGGIVCVFGEIDIRVHVCKMQREHRKTMQEVVDDIIKRYSRFLIWLRDLGYDVYCWGPIASQPDSCENNPKYPRNGSMFERNKATEYFNKELKQICLKEGIGFMSIFDKLVDDNYNTLFCYYSDDHVHLSNRAMILAKEEWEKYGFQTKG